MARKPGKTTRPKKNPRQSRPPVTASTGRVERPREIVPTEPALETDALALVPEADVPTPQRAGSSRRVRPYQQRKNAPTARVAAAASLTISKAQEYAFIREDLRRLLVTAGVLTVVMIGLLFVIDR